MPRTSLSVELAPAGGGERWSALAAVALLAAYAAKRRSVSGFCGAVMAMPLAYRGIAGRWPWLFSSAQAASDDTRVALAGERGMHVFETIRLEVPLEEACAFWRRFENLPRFMSHLDTVTQLSGRRSHWVAKGLAGLRFEWDAEIINEVPDHIIAWRSLAGADVVTAGSVNFMRAGQATQVSVHLQYAAPAGHVGAFMAGLFGREPSQMIRRDLRRLKHVLEGCEEVRASFQFAT